MLIVAIMFAGVFLGLLAPNKRLEKISYFITILIWVLLFLLGVEVGGDKTIIDGLYTLGFEAVVLMLGGVIGSSLFAYILYTYVQRKEGWK